MQGRIVYDFHRHIYNAQGVNKNISNYIGEVGASESMFNPMKFKLNLEDKKNVNGLMTLKDMSREEKGTEGSLLLLLKKSSIFPPPSGHPKHFSCVCSPFKPAPWLVSMWKKN
ncbi:hypothetical protein H1C71_023809 [Ictidomys tridecemlineatus]|nr:hypothetical protein H1C71_023809 [Ictidomys tridecemlineatus]